MLTNFTPSEFAISGIFVSPVLVAFAFGLLGAVATARLLNHYRLSRYVFYPPVVFVATTVIYTALIGTLLVPF